MVDINLFKNGSGEGEEEKEWDDSSSESDEFEDDLKNGLGFDDDLSAQDTFDESGLLDDEEPLPDFDEPEQNNNLDDSYEFGEVKEKKSSLWLWILMGIIVVTVVLYVFYIQPKQISKSFKVVQPVRAPVITPKTKTPEPKKTAEKAEEKPAAISAMADSSTKALSSSVVVYTNASKLVFDDLTSNAQFGGILFNGNQFLITYVSETPHVADAMGKRIKTLLQVPDYKVSPEDRNRISGKDYYWGIVSGQLQMIGDEPDKMGSKQFTNTEHFINNMKSLTDKYDLKIMETKALHSKATIKVEGSKDKIFQFLQSLRNVQGNYKLNKLFMTPLNESDFSGSTIKLILDFHVYVN
jgi:hypothetical protein